MVGVDTLTFVRTILEPYRKQGIQNWFYAFGMNDKEHNFVYFFDDHYSNEPVKSRKYQGMTNYFTTVADEDQLLMKIRKAFGANWYLCPANFSSAKFKAEYFRMSWWLYVDIDFKNYIDPNDEKKVREMLKEVVKVIKPHVDIIVFSGGGVHLYKKMDKPAESRLEWLTHEEVFVDLVRKITGLEPDPQVSNNHMNLLRIPGTVNLRYGNRRHRFVDLVYTSPLVVAKDF